MCFTCFQLLDSKIQTEDKLQNGGMEISSEKRRGRVQRKQRNGGRREEEKRQREEGVEQKCVARQRAGAERGVEKRARSQTSVGTLRMLEGARCHDQQEHGTLIML